MSFNPATKNPLIQQNPIFADTHSQLLKAIDLLNTHGKSIEQQIRKLECLLSENKEKIGTLQQAVRCLSPTESLIRQSEKPFQRTPTFSTRPKTLVLQALKMRTSEWVSFNEIMDFVMRSEKVEKLYEYQKERLRDMLNRLFKQGLVEKQGERGNRRWRIKAI